ncbi:MarR family transcriptional regulator [Citreimonas salinaria]|uniref:Transcriptional regulator, MarR family n=1 Tax=Citreimonas salinaria TaxID=321339 RepID=A0A1H3HDZ2_9RHOB|nr:MarR family transcriptional regulator [Citreimonas salinaria]SDY12869.1 transcriptional regulator, MarR family [Citreimonas salinaria]
MTVEDQKAGNHDLYSALHRARDAVLELYRPVLAQQGLTEPQWRTLVALDSSGPMDATRLAERAKIQPSSLSRIIRTFEERRLVATHRNADDARRLLLRLTPAGQATIARLRPGIDAVDRRLAARYGDTEITLLCQALEALRIVLDTQAPRTRGLRRKRR